MSESDILVDEEMEPNPDLNRITNAILGAAIEVHRTLGPGFPESVYGKALEIEFKARHIFFEAQCRVNVLYKGVLVGQGKMDFLVESKVIVEIKTVESFASIHTAQTVSYLRATGLRLALLINFNVRCLTDGIKRIAH
ncbi:MAG TPA: GxxExxY protein [Tepidisphaeraceae bacterium]|jgi:GxxExxY protein